MVGFHSCATIGCHCNGACRLRGWAELTGKTETRIFTLLDRATYVMKFVDRSPILLLWLHEEGMAFPGKGAIPFFFLAGFIQVPEILFIHMRYPDCYLS